MTARTSTPHRAEPDDDLKAMTIEQLRSYAKGWLYYMSPWDRKEHKWTRETFLLPILDEFKTRPEAQQYGALYAFLRDIDVKPGTVRQWRLRQHSPRPSNGRKRSGNGRGGRGGWNGWNGPARYAHEVLPEAIGSVLQELANGNASITAALAANGNASLLDRVARFLGAVDADGHIHSKFRAAFILAGGDALAADGNASSGGAA